MPHVNIKMFPGRTDAQKDALVEKVSRAVMESVNVEEKSVSISIEEIKKEDWDKLVVGPDIKGRPDILVKKPGY